MNGGVDLTRRENFAFFYVERLRFSDTDLIGHVNNVAFAALMESGRVHFTRSGVLRFMPPELLVVMRRIELEYRGELHWPGDVDVGARLLAIGRTSFTIGNGVFDGERCVATGVTTLVVIGRESRASVAIPDAVRAGMEGYL